MLSVVYIHSNYNTHPIFSLPPPPPPPRDPICAIKNYNLLLWLPTLTSPPSSLPVPSSSLTGPSHVAIRRPSEALQMRWVTTPRSWATQGASISTSSQPSTLISSSGWKYTSWSRLTIMAMSFSLAAAGLMRATVPMNQLSVRYASTAFCTCLLLLERLSRMRTQ